MDAAFVAHTTPWPHWTTEAALHADDLARLRAAAAAADRWDRHDSFYQCWMADVSDALPASWGPALAAALAPRLGAPLLGVLRVTVQRMDPGDRALPHTDRALAGYEAARLIVQLTDRWAPDQGGTFDVASDADMRGRRRRAPRAGSGVAFLLRPGSWHEVEPVAPGAVRWTAVFNLWHAGNPPGLDAVLRARFDGMHQRHLPRALDPIAVRAEEAWGEAPTAGAANAAWIALRWGLSPDGIAAAYVAALPDALAPPPEARLAAWIGSLRDGDFDPDRWRETAAALRGADLDPRCADDLARFFPPAAPTDGRASFADRPGEVSRRLHAHRP